RKRRAPVRDPPFSVASALLVAGHVREREAGGAPLAPAVGRRAPEVVGEVRRIRALRVRRQLAVDEALGDPLPGAVDVRVPVDRAAAVAVAGRGAARAVGADDVRERTHRARAPPEEPARADILSGVDDVEAAALTGVRAGLAEVLTDDRRRPRADVDLRRALRIRTDVDVVRRR